MLAEVILSFTGTREGLSAQQLMALRALVNGMRPIAAHHGDCVGADETFHAVCLVERVPVVLHPPQNEMLRAFCEGAIDEEPPRAYLTRNRNVVECGTLLVACPKESTEPKGRGAGGTWQTVRYARKQGRVVVLLWPDGRVTVDIGEVYSSSAKGN